MKKPLLCLSLLLATAVAQAQTQEAPNNSDLGTGRGLFESKKARQKREEESRQSMAGHLADLQSKIDPATGRVCFSGVEPVADIASGELYARGLVWFASAFRSAKDVVQANDKEAGLLVGKATSWTSINIRAMGMDYPFSQWIRYTVKLTFRDGRYRYEVTDIGLEGLAGTIQSLESLMAAVNDSNLKSKSLPYQQIEGTYQTVTGLIPSIREGMLQPAAGGDGKW